ncbi:MAG: hypothetical protein SW019_04220 [Actinomycetota bacterium]|nr:hypothetical protein [Actinomycetota bacterium]
MQSGRFRPLTTAEGPFASVAVDDSHDTADADKQLELRWRAVEEELAAGGADAELISSVRRGFTETPHPVGQAGLAVIANREMQFTETLIRPPELPTTRVSTLPYLVPVVVHGVDDPPALIVEVDHAGADITVRHGARMRSTSVDAGNYPVHKASGAETAGYGDPKGPAEEAARKNLRATADEVAGAFDEVSPEVVWVVGEVRSRADLVATLPARVAEQVIEVDAGARGNIDVAALEHAIETRLQQRRADVIDTAAQRFRAEMDRDSGLATEGLAGVCAALREGAVETLMIGDLDDTTVLVGDSPTVLAPTPEVLSELGSVRSETVRADEALPFAAVLTDAELIALDQRMAPRDGVAAVLRYPRHTAAAT